jgi:hypothetical protein
VRSGAAEGLAALLGVLLGATDWALRAGLKVRREAARRAKAGREEERHRCIETPGKRWRFL